MMNPKNKIWKPALLTISIAPMLSSASAAPSPSSGTLEAYIKLSDVLDNHTIFSAPQEGSETVAGLVGYWGFNNDSAVGEAYNGTNASLVYLVNSSGFIRNYESIDISTLCRNKSRCEATSFSQFDYSGEGNNGVWYTNRSIVGGGWNSSGGKFGGAFEFDGLDNWV